MLKPIGGGRYETKFEILDVYQLKVDSDRSCNLRRRSHTHYERFIPSIYVLRDYGTAGGTRVEVYFTARGFRQRQAQNSLIVDQARKLQDKPTVLDPVQRRQSKTEPATGNSPYFKE
ncbi:uncharacterized protein LOC120426594 isoform X2 [Culex pipiens pallens]|uniref:uncharacterized protein LOC120426594 isoform X2 n=1 Tax=Culex pipiens pallens TaxID=42434 RepID=UPI0022AA35CC|nr:uncharacterized protein LOC120426594 isoform X2 [Culex pipiens pallens]